MWRTESGSAILLNSPVIESYSATIVPWFFFLFFEKKNQRNSTHINVYLTTEKGVFHQFSLIISHLIHDIRLFYDRPTHVKINGARCANKFPKYYTSQLSTMISTTRKVYKYDTLYIRVNTRTQLHTRTSRYEMSSYFQHFTPSNLRFKDVSHSSTDICADGIKKASE